MNSSKLLVPTLLLALAGSAHAQNALGDGRSLDNNLQIGSGRINAPRVGIQDDLNFRNAVVTGNVGGGREFRGDTGYTAANDFRGTLGSDDLFRFRADTAFNSGSVYSGYSGLATNNLRGLGAIQMQLDLPVLGQTRGLAGNLIINREGAGFSGSEVQEGLSTAPRIDPYGSINRSLRSTSAYLIDNAVQPEVLATIGAPIATDPNAAPSPYTQSYQMLLTASELHGVRPLSESSPAINRARPAQANPAIPTPGTEPGLIPGQLDPNAPGEPVSTTGDKVSGSAVSTKLEPQVGTYEAAMEELRVRADKFQLASGSTPPARPEVPGAEGDPTEAPTPEQAFDNLNRSLDALRDAMTAAPETTEPPTDPSKLFLSEEKPEVDPAAGEHAEPPATRLEMVQRAQKLLGEQEITINTLRPAQTTNDIFAEHMDLGEKAMAEGRWFDAEERFTAAIAIKQGDPMAAAGRVNSQLAAGMYLSASLNLRNLLQAYPELLSVRFSDSLLPRAERLDRVRSQLRGRSQLDSDMARNAGFLLAYLGHQTGNAQDVTDGFAIIDRVDSAQKARTDPLLETCRAMWAK